MAELFSAASSPTYSLHPSIGMYYGMALMYLYPEVGNLVLAYLNLSFETHGFKEKKSTRTSSTYTRTKDLKELTRIMPTLATGEDGVVN